MAFRQRSPTFRPQLSVRRVYETLQPRSEMKETPEAYLLHVYLPGFTKDRIKIILDDSSQMVRISGEKPIQGNKWIRFDQTYPIPENSVAESLEAKFEQVTLIIKMQKKFIPQVSPNQEVETTQVKSPKGPSDKAVDEAKHEKIQETINPPQQSTTTKLEEPIEDKKSVSFPSPVKVPADHFKPQKEDTSSQIPPETIGNANNNPRKGQEEAKETKKLIGETQMLKEEFEPKPTSTETTKSQTDEKPQKGQQEVEPNPTVTTADSKEKLKEKIVETSVEDAEKERISKREVKEEYEKPSDMEKGKDTEPLAAKVEEKEKVSCCRNSVNQEGKSSGEDVIVGNGIRKLATCSSQFVTRVAEGKWSDEERYLLENVGAAVLVIAALGAYVSYRFAS